MNKKGTYIQNDQTLGGRTTNTALDTLITTTTNQPTKTTTNYQPTNQIIKSEKRRKE
jgi:hypothetical protein